MDVKPLKIVDAGTAGYRTPTALGTVDVFYKRMRYVFLAPPSCRVAWRGAVARLILGPRGKSSDVVPIARAGADLRRGENKAKAYRVGRLDSRPIRVRRQPGDDPLYTTGGKRKAGARELLELVDVFRAGDPRRELLGWGKRRGCFLVVDMLTGHAFMFKAPEGGRSGARGLILQAWAVGSGPEVEVRGAWPAYGVLARGWSAEERGRIMSAAAKAGRDKAADLRLAKVRAAEKAARGASAAAEKAARGRIAKAARGVNLAAISLKRAEVSAVRWPGGAVAEKVEAKRRALGVAWDDYHRQVAVDGGRVKGAAPISKPRASDSRCGALPVIPGVTISVR